MTDTIFIEILEELSKIHTEFPDMRFGLVIQNAMDSDKRINNVNLNDRSSKQILTALKKFNSDNKSKREKVKK
jgi:hypothetical protein